MAQIFLPETANKIYGMLNLPADAWQGAVEQLKPGHTISTAEILFEKITDEMVEAERQKLQPAENLTNTNFPPMKELISFDDFTKMDLRLGKVIAAKKMENADKLLVLTVLTGIDERTIVSGIAMHYTAEEIVGKSVVVLMNLAPRKIRGVESHGMLLMAENEEGKLSALVSERGFEEGPTIS
jgi:methionyl-tRNA synthetase